MSIQDDFKAFLHDIEPSETTKKQISSAHHAIRDYLSEHGAYSGRCLKTYLSGSYAKRTCIRPAKDNDNRDVDVVVETDYKTDANSADVIIEVRDVLEESPKYSTAHLQTHSVGLSLAKLDIDVVPLATEGDDRFIGCLDDGGWSKTDPKGHIKWSSQTNVEHDGTYKPVIKIMKWWRRENCPEDARWPKGITLEKIVADCFPEDASLYEDIVIGLMQNVLDAFSEEVSEGTRPVVVDPVLATNDLAEGYTIDDFRSFLDGVSEALEILDEDGSRNKVWRRVLGDRFPAESSRARATGPVHLMSSEQATRVSHREASPWPFTRKRPSVHVVADVTFPDGHVERISSNDQVIPKGCSIVYHAIRPSGISAFGTRWQVVNTGREALEDGCLRGQFEMPNVKNGGRREETAYTGRHYVQCLVIRNGYCVAHSREFFIIVE